MKTDELVGDLRAVAPPWVCARLLVGAGYVSAVAIHISFSVPD